MRTTIQSNDFPLTKPLKSFILRQADKNRPLHTDQVTSVNVHLKDVNGPKGGTDKECVVEVRLSQLPSIVVKRRTVDAYISIRQALGRASRVVNRRLSRNRDKRVDVTGDWQ